MIEEFADAYLAGATPVPCIRCNERVEFGDLLATAHDLGADCMATGHYIRRSRGAGRGRVAPRRRSRPAIRAISCFPPRGRSWTFCAFRSESALKVETRALATRLFGLAVADKPDSQDICFVPNGSYATVIEKLRPDAAQPGEIVHLDGRGAGHSAGGAALHRRAAARVWASAVLCEPLICRAAARLGGAAGGRRSPRGAGAARQITVARGELAWRCAVRRRAVRRGGRFSGSACARRARPVRRACYPDGPARARVELLDPEEGVAPGQACVFYAPEGSQVLGGGWIWRGK